MFINTQNKCLYINHVNLRLDQSNPGRDTAQGKTRGQQNSNLYREYDARLRLMSTREKTANHVTRASLQTTAMGGHVTRRTVSLPTSLKVNLDTEDKRDLEILDTARDYLRELIESRKRARAPPAPCPTPAQSRPYTPAAHFRSKVHDRPKSCQRSVRSLKKRAQTARASLYSYRDDSKAQTQWDVEVSRPQSATHLSERRAKGTNKGAQNNLKSNKPDGDNDRRSSVHKTPDAVRSAGGSPDSEGHRTVDDVGTARDTHLSLPSTPDVVGTTRDTPDSEERQRILNGYRRASANTVTEEDDWPGDESVDIGFPQTQIALATSDERSRSMRSDLRNYNSDYSETCRKLTPGQRQSFTPPTPEKPPTPGDGRTRHSRDTHYSTSLPRTSKAVVNVRPSFEGVLLLPRQSGTYLSSAQRVSPAYGYREGHGSERPAWPSATDIMKLQAGGYAYKPQTSQQAAGLGYEQPEGSLSPRAEGGGVRHQASGTESDTAIGDESLRPKTPNGSRSDPIIVPSHTTTDCPLCNIYYDGEDIPTDVHDIHLGHSHQKGDVYNRLSSAPKQRKPFLAASYSESPEESPQSAARVGVRGSGRPGQRKNTYPGFCNGSYLDKMTNINSASPLQRKLVETAESVEWNKEGYAADNFPYKISYVNIHEGEN